MRYSCFIFVVCLFLSSFAKAQPSCALQIINTSCERLSNPVGIDIAQPRLSWQLSASCNRQKQSAYQILVASSSQKLEENEGDIWDSRKVRSSNSLNIPYQGIALETAQTYYWKVKVWNVQKEASAWSEVQQWTMGLLGNEAVQADWIGLGLPIDSASQAQKDAAHYLFTTFKTKEKKITNATAFVSGLGLFDLYINGELVSDHRLNPSNTNYTKRAIYVGFDVLEHLKNEENAVGIVLGNGKHLLQRKHRRTYGLPRLWCQIHVQYSDGSTQIIKSDAGWKMTTQGPVRFNNEFDGEHYDARLELKNWATANMDVTAWKSVDVLEDYQPILAPQLMPPVRVVERLTAQKITKSGEGKYIFDFGQNITGWGRLEAQAAEGTTIKLRFSELSDSQGNLDTASIRGAKATDVYIFKGKGKEVFEPRFTYHGFRYAEISGLTSPPDTSTLKACVAHNDLQAVGSFVCSNPLLNQIYANAKWSLRGNYQHVPVDCPQRDERYGWLGDRPATAFGELYLYDIQHFYAKWMQDIADEQLASGALPNVAPAHWKVFRDNVTWPATYVQLVGLLYRYYDDSLAVAKNYDSMKKWMDYIAENYSKDQVVYADQYGDWFVPPEKITEENNEDPRLKSSADIMASATYLLALKDMYAFANLLEKKEEARSYQAQIEGLKNVLYERLLDRNTFSYGNHSPTELLLLLAQGDLPRADRSLLLENLLGMLRGQYNGKMTFGSVGMRWPMQVFSENGAVDFAYQLATSRAYPSWGYMVDQGATTMWEVWNGKEDRSHNHVMLIGDLLQWFYAYLGGIQQVEGGKAFDKIKLLPHLPEGLDSVDVSFNSPRGKIVSRWKIVDNKLNWHVEIPVGTTAEIYLPNYRTLYIFEGGELLTLDTLIGNRNYTGVRMGSGTYDFVCNLPPKNEAIIHSHPPEISLQDSIIAKNSKEEHWVEFTAEKPKTKIYYTLDGRDPNTKSTRYKKPFELENAVMIKAIAVEKGKAPSFIKNSFVDFYDSKVNGWNYAYYEGKFRQLPDFDTLVAVNSGQVSHINLSQLKQRPHYWAFRFEAYLDIPKDGEYTFYLACDDGARLVIDEQEVVINDGVHYKTQRNGRIYLKKGKHPIRLEHFNLWSFNDLELMISGPELARQRVPVGWVYY